MTSKKRTKKFWIVLKWHLENFVIKLYSSIYKSTILWRPKAWQSACSSQINFEVKSTLREKAVKLFISFFILVGFNHLTIRSNCFKSIYCNKMYMCSNKSHIEQHCWFTLKMSVYIVWIYFKECTLVKAIKWVWILLTNLLAKIFTMTWMKLAWGVRCGYVDVYTSIL